MLKFAPPILALTMMLAGCVAPEEPQAPRAASRAVSQPTSSTAKFEDAPVPNRRANNSVDDSVIRIAH